MTDNTKPMMHRPIDARHGVKPHGGTARSLSGKMRGKK